MLLFIYFQREGKGGRNVERKINVREIHPSVASPARPDQRPNLQPRHVFWLGIKLGTESATFRFAGQRPTNWATLVKVNWHFFLQVATPGDIQRKASLPRHLVRETQLLKSSKLFSSSFNCMSPFQDSEFHYMYQCPKCYMRNIVVLYLTFIVITKYMFWFFSNMYIVATEIRASFRALMELSCTKTWIYHFLFVNNNMKSKVFFPNHSLCSHCHCLNDHCSLPWS